MRPFRFFFALSLGIFIFFFVARFLVMALVAAAVLGLSTGCTARRVEKALDLPSLLISAQVRGPAEFKVCLLCLLRGNY